MPDESEFEAACDVIVRAVEAGKDGIAVPSELLVEQVIRLVNQANGDVGNYLRLAGLHKLAVKLKGVWCLAAESPDEHGLFGVFVPDGMVAHAKVVAIVGEQNFHRSARHNG